MRLSLRKDSHGMLLPYVGDDLLEGLIRVELLVDSKQQVLRLEFDPRSVQFSELDVPQTDAKR